jgi:hypothetical protein
MSSSLDSDAEYLRRRAEVEKEKTKGSGRKASQAGLGILKKYQSYNSKLEKFKAKEAVTSKSTVDSTVEQLSNPVEQSSSPTEASHRLAQQDFESKNSAVTRGYKELDRLVNVETSSSQRLVDEVASPILERLDDVGTTSSDRLVKRAKNNESVGRELSSSRRLVDEKDEVGSSVAVSKKKLTSSQRLVPGGWRFTFLPDSKVPQRLVNVESSSRQRLVAKVGDAPKSERRSSSQRLDNVQLTSSASATSLPHGEVGDKSSVPTAANESQDGILKRSEGLQTSGKQASAPSRGEAPFAGEEPDSRITEHGQNSDVSSSQRLVGHGTDRQQSDYDANTFLDTSHLTSSERLVAEPSLSNSSNGGFGTDVNDEKALSNSSNGGFGTDVNDEKALSSQRLARDEKAKTDAQLESKQDFRTQHLSSSQRLVGILDAADARSTEQAQVGNATSSPTRQLLSDSAHVKPSSDTIASDHGARQSENLRTAWQDNDFTSLVKNLAASVKQPSSEDSEKESSSSQRLVSKTAIPTGGVTTASKPRSAAADGSINFEADKTTVTSDGHANSREAAKSNDRSSFGPADNSNLNSEPSEAPRSALLEIPLKAKPDQAILTSSPPSPRSQKSEKTAKGIVESSSSDRLNNVESTSRLRPANIKQTSSDRLNNVESTSSQRLSDVESTSSERLAIRLGETTPIVGISALGKLELKLLKVIFNDCKQSASLVSKPFTNRELVAALEIQSKSSDTARKHIADIVKRLMAKGLITKPQSRTGPAGWAIYELSQSVYQSLVNEENSSTQRLVNRLENGSINLSITKSNSNSNSREDGDVRPTIKNPFEEIDLSPVAHLGITKKHMYDIFKNKWNLTVDEVTDLIAKFPLYAKTEIRDASPINGPKIFMSILKIKATDGTCVLDVMDSEVDLIIERQLSQYREKRDARARRLEQLASELFDDWRTTLSEDEIRAIPGTKMVQADTPPFHAILLTYFKVNIWPTKMSELGIKA